MKLPSNDPMVEIAYTRPDTSPDLAVPLIINLIANGERHPSSVTGTANNIIVPTKAPTTTGPSNPATARAAHSSTGRDKRGINPTVNAPQAMIWKNVRC